HAASPISSAHGERADLQRLGCARVRHPVDGGGRSGVVGAPALFPNAAAGHGLRPHAAHHRIAVRAGARLPTGGATPGNETGRRPAGGFAGGDSRAGTVGWGRRFRPMPLSSPDAEQPALIVGQDGILRAGWQPAPAGLFTRGSGGLPTRRRLPTQCHSFFHLRVGSAFRTSLFQFWARALRLGNLARISHRTSQPGPASEGKQQIANGINLWGVPDDGRQSVPSAIFAALQVSRRRWLALPADPARFATAVPVWPE